MEEFYSTPFPRISESIHLNRVKSTGVEGEPYVDL
jgi:hypothetical protein